MKTAAKKSVVFLLAMSLILSLFAAIGLGGATTIRANAAVLSGSGTASSPYLIQSESDFALLKSYTGNTYLGKEFKLTRNLDLSGYPNWEPIGTASAPFRGYFNGAGYVISGIQINRPGETYVGLFGYVNRGIIRNLGIDGTIIGGANTGGIAGYLHDMGIVTNCYNLATVTSNAAGAKVGGIVGSTPYYSYAQIDACYNAGEISGAIVGGIIGNFEWYAWAGVTNCYNTGAITGITNTAQWAGGIVGRLYSSSISHCYNTGKITADPMRSDSQLGAIIGVIHDEYHSAVGAGLHYNKETSGTPYGISYSDHSVTYRQSTAGSGTTAQMMQKSTYTAFSFTTRWYMKNGAHYPILRSMVNFTDKNGVRIHPKMSYTVRFTGNGGEFVSGTVQQDVYHGEDAVDIPVFKMNGHVANGWVGDYTNVTSNREIIQQWRRSSVTVTFHYSGAVLDGLYTDGTDFGTYATQVVDYGAHAVYPKLKRDGYAFLGWDKSNLFMTDNTVITANWTQGNYSYRLDTNGGTLPPGESSEGHVNAGEELKFLPTPSKAGSTFLGWEREFINNTLIATANWAADVTVVFNLDGGERESGILSQTIPYGSAAAAPVNVTKAGHNFAGWDRAFQRIYADTTVTATYIVKSYTVSFESGGGVLVSGDTTQIVPYGKAAEPPVFVRPDRMVTGWDKDFSSIRSDITITAQWDPVFYTVTFDADASDAVWDSTTPSLLQRVAHGGTAHAPVLSRTGFVLNGWDKALNNITKETVITAQWVPLKITVVFQGNGGTMSNSAPQVNRTVNYGDNLTPPVFTLTGHTLTGWSAAGTGVSYPADLIDSVTASMTLTAIWTPAKYTVVFIGNGGKTSTGAEAVERELTHGSDLSQNAPSFTRAGYALTSWGVTLPSGVVQNMTVFAQWAFKELVPNIEVSKNPDGTSTLKVTNLESLEQGKYTYRWEKSVGETWQTIEDAVVDSIVISADSDYSMYRVVVGVFGVSPGEGTIGPSENGYTSGEDSYTNEKGEKLHAGIVGGTGRMEFSASQKVIIAIAVLVGVLLLILIMFLVIRSVLRSKKHNQSHYFYNGRF